MSGPTHRAAARHASCTTIQVRRCGFPTPRSARKAGNLMLSNLSNETVVMLETVDQLQVRTATLRQQVQESIVDLHLLIEDAAILRDELREALHDAPGNRVRPPRSQPLPGCRSCLSEGWDRFSYGLGRDTFPPRRSTPSE
jgi:hypothetical protein